MKKTFKFSITMLSAFMTAYSPVASANTMSLNDKIAFNQALKANFSGTYGDYYAKHSHLFDAPSKGHFEQWLANYGTQKLPQPQAQMVKDKNGNDVMKLFVSHNGKTLTVTQSATRPDQIDVNGKTIAVQDTQNIAKVAAVLAETDSSYRNLANQLKTKEAPISRKFDRLSVTELFRLSPIERVEYMMKVRQTVEAAAEVMNAKQAGEQAFSNFAPSQDYVLQALFSSHFAWAVGIPFEGDGCVVAGNLSVYERDGKKGKLACATFPTKYPQGFNPPKRFEDKCPNQTPTGKSFKGAPVACNPFVYGFSKSGKGVPFCVDSGDQPGFTDTATKQCDEASPLNKNNPDELKKDYRRILESFAKAESTKGKSDDQISACFAGDKNDIRAQDPKAQADCKAIFDEQITKFEKFKADAEKVCATNNDRATKDKKSACEHLLARSLELGKFLEGISQKRDPDVVIPPVVVDRCGPAGLKPMPGTGLCYCKNNTVAIETGGKPECPEDKIVLPPPVVKKDECPKDKKDGKEEPKCSRTLWPLFLLPLLAIPFFGKDKKDKPTPTTLPTQTAPPVKEVVPAPKPTIPPGPGPGPTPTTPTQPPPPPTVPTVPKPTSEGGTAPRPSGDASGVRQRPPATK